MRWQSTLWLGLSLSGFPAWSVAALPAAAEPVGEFRLVAEESPYRHNGLIRTVDGSRASGVVVQERVVLTAAHVIHRTSGTRRWVGATFYPRHHRTFASSNRPQVEAAGSHRWESYSQRMALDPGQNSSYDTFNLDAAALYFAHSPPDFLPFATVHVDAENEVALLRDPSPKRITGYPITYTLSSRRGLLHEILAENYLFYWRGITRDSSTWRDSEDIWIALAWSDEFLTRGGHSGGPVWVQGDRGEWRVGAIVVGGLHHSTRVESLVRGIDENAYQLIHGAAMSGGSYRVRRPENLRAEAFRGGVVLHWESPSSGISSYRIERLESGIWRTLAKVGAGTREYTDRSARSGRGYRYRVQAYLQGVGESPTSVVAGARVPGWDNRLGRGIGQPWLAWKTYGDGAFFADGDGLRSGRTRSMGSSTLELEVEGPGTLRFVWSVSSEENEDFATPGSSVEGDIYDAFYFEINGEEDRWISGEVAPREVKVSLPAGRNTLRWVYDKDPYADEGADAGWLHELEWHSDASPMKPSAGRRHLPGTFDLGGNWRSSPAIGSFYLPQEGSPWIYHPVWGWIAPRIAEHGVLFAYRSASEDWLYWSIEHPQAYFCFREQRWHGLD